jgi:outer membrane protein TolC
MISMGRAFVCVTPILILGFAGGCGIFRPVAPFSNIGSISQVDSPGQSPPKRTPNSDIALASLQVVPEASPSAEHYTPPFLEQTELSLNALIEQVLARNPSLAQMEAVQRAAAARYPQVTSLDDPMFAGTIGPGTIAPDDRGVEFAYRLDISQKIPYPGKLRLRGENAQAEAAAALNDVDDMRLQLIETTRNAFYDYFLADRALEVNHNSLDLLHLLRKNAESRYAANQSPEQDMLQAEVEIGKEQERRLELEQMRQVAVARLNTLMHYSPDSSLPPPPKENRRLEKLLDVRALRETALARRPDLQALREHIAAEEASLELARKEFYPDFEPFFMYDRFMGNVTDNRDLATMLGLRMNLPVNRRRRNASVEEAEARLAQRNAELTRLTDQISLQVQEAYARVQQSEKSLRLYQDTILPAAERNVKSAEAAYANSKIPFLSLIEAERGAVNLRDRYYEVLADSYRRRASLGRAIGGPVP